MRASILMAGSLRHSQIIGSKNTLAYLASLSVTKKKKVFDICHQVIEEVFEHKPEEGAAVHRWGVAAEKF